MKPVALCLALALAAPATPAAAAASALARFAERGAASAACDRAMRQDNLDEQIRLYTLCIDTGGATVTDAGALALRGFAYLYKGETDAALADFDAAIAEDDEFAGYYLDRAQAYVRLGRHDDALADIAAALERRGAENEALTYIVRAEALAGKGAEAEALADFDRAQDLRRRNVRALAGKAYLLAAASDAALRDGAQALALAQEAADRDDKSIEAQRALAAAHAELGDFAAAVAAQTRALEMVEEKLAKDAYVFDPAMRDHLALYRASQPLRGVRFW